MQTTIFVYPKVRVVYGQVALVAKDGSELSRLGLPWPEVRERFLQLSCIPHPGLL